MNANGFGNPSLASMLAIGAITSYSARIWYRTPDGEHYHLQWRHADSATEWGRQPLPAGNPAADFTGSVLISAGLQADSRYTIELLDATGKQHACGSFRMAPTEGYPVEHFALAFLSCHQPFDEQGNVAPEAEQMLAAMHQAFKEHDVRQVILGGDQMYSDFPRALSLFNSAYFSRVAPRDREQILECSAEEVRSLFHQRYRHFWNIDGWRELLSNYPCYPILDDHDIVDNWGSVAEHTDPQWQCFRRGAFQAYCDYQAAMVAAPISEPPADLDYASVQANTATYVLDLRSNRQVGKAPGLISKQQYQSLREFLTANSQRDVVFIVLSVPMIHLPKALSRFVARVCPGGEDFSDRWSSRGHILDRDRVLRLIHDHQGNFPDQRVVLLSGDIHIGCLHQVHWPDREPNLYQLVSSGITHHPGRFVQTLSSAIIRCKKTLDIKNGPKASVYMQKGIKGAAKNPCGQMNFGIVELTRHSPGSAPKLEFFLYSHDKGRPVCRYRSGVL